MVVLIYLFWPSGATPTTETTPLPYYVGPAEVVPSGEEAAFEAEQKVYEEEKEIVMGKNLAQEVSSL